MMMIITVNYKEYHFVISYRGLQYLNYQYILSSKTSTRTYNKPSKKCQ